ncbi:MAG: UvrD-helicase domain-containing protein, partial [Alphaproteobacteria bacterium]
AAACALQTRDLLILGNEILNQYQELKREQAVLDYDDLIFTTLALLEGRTGSFGKNAAAWVLYKLDHGLEHILVDEAQDTNPEQWKIIKALCEEFTDGQGAADIDRSIFVVGDEKQSIYSFQRASPQEFSNMQQFLRSKTKAAGKNWDDVPMNISFRSAKSVLQIVDAVFTGAMQYGVSKTPVTHTSFRIGQAGRIELWPLCTTDAKETFNPWTPPVQIVESTNGSTRLAAKIAETIEHWIKSGEKLPSKNEGIKPGDIMILLRTRSAFFTQIAKALKDRKIPVSGTDRMILNTQIAVQDLLAFAQFALQPLDDLNLACLLKSPLVGMDEDSLFALAHNRKGTLWDELLQRGSPETKNYLNRILQNAPGQRPFDFFSDLLQSPCPADNQSGGRAIQKRLGHDSTDPIDELLNAALNYESGHIPSLQHFLQWQTASKTEIKREMEEKGGFVRIMTIHGAKGLQAPIVILPDTIRSNSGGAAKADDRLLWPDKTGFPLPLWSPRKDDMFTEYSNARAVIQQRTDEEYRRLLYVAMTRAEDRLYLCGYTSQKPAKIESWYDALKTGMTSLETVIELEDGSLRLDNPQTRDPETKDKTAPKTAAAQKIPEYLYKPADHEAAPAAPLSPSRGAGDETEPAALSPSRPDSPHRFRRGNLTHKLLEVLPALPQQKRETAAEKFLARFAPDLDEDTRRSIIKETITILDHPDYAPIFGPGSLAEIAIAGTMKNRQAISGKIDRLLITPTHIYIIDYKTNRPPPQDPASIPALYRNQMAAYADILSQIYPKREVKCALLWTDGPRLMPLKT